MDGSKVDRLGARTAKYNLSFSQVVSCGQNKAIIYAHNPVDVMSICQQLITVATKHI